MKKDFIVLFLIVFFSITCIKNKKYQTIKIKFNNTSINLSKFFTNAEFKFLKVPDSIVIGEIDRYFTVKQYQILVDSKYSKAIYIFDQNDNYLNKIDSHGEAPDEFNHITDCTVSEKFIFLLDVSNKKINIYRISDGKYENSLVLDSYIGGIIYFKDYIYAYSFEDYSGNNYFLSKINIATGEISAVIKNIPKILRSIPSRGINHFNVFKNDLYFFPPYSNKIYKISDDGKIDIAYILDNPLIHESIRLFENFEPSLKVRKEIFKKYTTIQNFHISNNYVFLNIPIDNNMFQGFVYKNIFKGELFNSFIDDINNIGIGSYIDNNKNQYITSIQIEDILMLYEKIKIIYKKNHQKVPDDIKIQQIINKIKNNNGPVLMFFKIKGEK
ncbi:MAG: hypothetical protein Kow00108_01890 [Calditrichia bacterium]